MDISLIQVDKNSPVSLAQQIANSIIFCVENNIIAPGEKLPTERELSEAYGIARGTVKNAYKKLESMSIIQTRQGSGSFVANKNNAFRESQKFEAAAIVDKAVLSLRSLGLKDDIIRHLVDLSLSKDSERNLHAAIIYDNAEFLINFKNQLAYIPRVSFSIFILESILEDKNPEKLLSGYDLIIVPSKLFVKVSSVMPNFSNKLIEAAVSPSKETIVSIAALNRESRIGIICRTNAFLEAVKNSLLSFGFQEDKILSFFEMNYTVNTYFPGGIDVLISFSDAHIFTLPAFDFRNKELLAKGGKIIAFDYSIDSGSLIYIENKVKQLIKAFDQEA